LLKKRIFYFQQISHNLSIFIDFLSIFLIDKPIIDKKVSI
jgi:hypothetical protein